MRRDRSTRSGGIPLPDAAAPVEERRRARPSRTVRALLELVRSRRRLRHVPTVMQVRALAHFAGREPQLVPAGPDGQPRARAPARREDPLGRPALRFTGECPQSGRRVELVTLPDGCAFDLLA